MSNIHTPATRIHSMSISGNLHAVAQAVNSLGWSDFLVSAEYSYGSSVVLLRFPSTWPFDSHGPLAARTQQEPL